MNKTATFAFAAALALGGCAHGFFAADDPSAGVASEIAPQDRSDTAHDEVMTHRIRSAIGGDAALALVAPNIAILTAQHTVVLQGRVTSETQRRAAAGYARACEGVTHVDNQLVVGL